MKRPSLQDLQDLVWEGRYAIKSHAIRHAIAEGFTEADIVKTLQYGRELAVYPEDSRMLVLGYINISPQLRIPLHVVLDYSPYRWLDVVTAFIPTDPYRVWSRERVAILVHHGHQQPRERLVRPRAQSGKPRAWRLRGV
jgi:hypothetical protein